MIVSNRMLRAAIPAVVLVGLLTACGSKSSSGTPVAPNEPNAPGPDAPGPSPEVPEVFKVDACTMVPENLLKEMEFDVPGKGSFKKDTPEEDLSGNHCYWQKGYTGKMLTVSINEGTPGSGKPSDAAAPVESTLDGRKALRYQDKIGVPSCETAIVVGPKVYVDVQADGADTFDTLCGKVDKALPSVSSKIPD